MTSEVFNSDCLEGMRQYPDKYFDLAIVDPPYGLGMESDRIRHGTYTVPQKNGVKLFVQRTDYGTKKWDAAPPDESYFLELKRVSMHQIIWGANHYLDQFPFSLSTPCWIVWDKVNGDAHQADCELAWTSFDTAVRQFEFMWNGMCQGSAEDGRKMQGNKALNERRIHPTQKPIQLYKWLLTNYAKPGDKILDTHLGSGSSRIAAYDLGFDFTAFEIDKDYFDAQEKRFQQFKSQLKIFNA